MTDTGQRRLDAHNVDRRPLPENVPDLDAECCWQCHNPVSMMHTLVCESCGYEVKGPAVQDCATCPSCSGSMQCTRYIRRWHTDEDDTFRKRRFHPETGEQMPLDDLRAEGFK